MTKLEIRVPISPRDGDMRMLRYLLASIQLFGGPIARAAHCVASVGEDEPPRDLAAEYPWTADYSVEFQWLDRELFRSRSYDATGFHRMWVRSDADVVALIDADLLVARSFDDIVQRANREQTMVGYIGHVSPFTFAGLNGTPSRLWWERMFAAAGLPEPQLAFEHPFWDFDWESNGFESISSGVEHRRCPPYYNYGLVMGPRRFIEQMGQSFEAELEAVDSVMETMFKSQIANCLAFARHGIPCITVPIEYNLPLNLPAGAVRSARAGPDGWGSGGGGPIRIFHYIGGRHLFESEESLQALLARSDLRGPWRGFQRRLQRVHDTISRSSVG